MTTSAEPCTLAQAPISAAQRSAPTLAPGEAGCIAAQRSAPTLAVYATTLGRRTPGGDVLVDGAMTIRDLNRATDWSLPDDEANTIAGLVIHEAQTIPVKGQVFSFHGFRFEITDRVENRITRLKIRKL